MCLTHKDASLGGEGRGWKDEMSWILFLIMTEIMREGMLYAVYCSASCLVAVCFGSSAAGFSLSLVSAGCGVGRSKR